MRRFHRLIASIAIVLVTTSCSSSVKIPLDQIDEATWRKPGKYRLRLTDGGEYYVRRFSVVDSSVVVDERIELDEALYSDTNPPSNSIPVDQLRSVEKVESRTKTILLLTAIVGGMVTFFALMGGQEDQ